MTTARDSHPPYYIAGTQTVYYSRRQSRYTQTRPQAGRSILVHERVILIASTYVSCSTAHSARITDNYDQFSNVEHKASTSTQATVSSTRVAPFLSPPTPTNQMLRPLVLRPTLCTSLSRDFANTRGIPFVYSMRVELAVDIGRLLRVGRISGDDLDGGEGVE